MEGGGGGDPPPPAPPFCGGSSGGAAPWGSAAAAADLVGEVRRVDDERVALPVASRVAHIEMYVPAEAGRCAGCRNHAVFVNHLVLNHDVARSLENARAVAVNGRQDRADHAARDAAVVIAVELGGVVLPEKARAALRGALLPSRRERRQAAVRRVDH